jgi:hypothetical protein
VYIAASIILYAAIAAAVLLALPPSPLMRARLFPDASIDAVQSTKVSTEGSKHAGGLAHYVEGTARKAGGDAESLSEASSVRRKADSGLCYFLRVHKRGFVICITCAAIILAASWVMGICPIYNGEVETQRNQYELMAKALLQGHLYLDLPVDQNLLSLDNPYDPVEREASGFDYYWDHALYNGRYYMYFGVVPVLVVFLPWLAITGASLTTYHATQLFVAAFVIGLFTLFRMLARRFFPDMSFGLYLFASASSSICSIWYIAAAPALYCTAIAAGIAFMIWAVILMLSAAFPLQETSTSSRVVKVFFGCLCGALVFGCRPPIGLAGIVLLPLLWRAYRDMRGAQCRVGTVVSAVLPYLVVAIFLCLYNYARFDNPFEFGQSYQLTVTDQRDLSFTDIFNLSVTLPGLWSYFFQVQKGVFMMFPTLFVGCVLACVFGIGEKNAARGIRPLLIAAIIACVAVVSFDCAWSPYIILRYRSDLYWLVCVVAYVGFAAFFQWCKKSTRRDVVSDVLRTAVCAAYMIAALTASVLIFYPITDLPAVWDSQIWEIVKQVLTFGLL